MDWSVRNLNVIYSIDEEGHLVSWYLSKSRVRKFRLVKMCPKSLHVSPHEDIVIAFGTKIGLIFIAWTDPAGARAKRN